MRAWAPTFRSSSRSANISSALAASGSVPCCTCFRRGSADTGNTTAEYILGSVVEYIHTASLLHDDVVDEAKIRRGRSSANSLWGNQASILVGDYLYSKALYHAVRLQNQRVMDVLSETTTTMSEGEVLQLMQIQNADITEADYFRLVECKTGVLISASCRLGAIISKAPLSQEDALTAYGKKLGLAFQITDDTLDYAADQKQLGKVLGKDLDEGKVTLPLIYLIRKADAGRKGTHLRSILHADAVTEDDLTYTLGLMEKYGTVDEALDVAQSLSERSEGGLGRVPRFNAAPGAHGACGLRGAAGDVMHPLVKLAKDTVELYIREGKILAKSGKKTSRRSLSGRRGCSSASKLTALSGGASVHFSPRSQR